MNETKNITFNVSRTINIGNFEAIKINYGESIELNPERTIEEQRKELIESCYKIVSGETKIWKGLKEIQHTNNITKETTVLKPKSK